MSEENQVALSQTAGAELETVNLMDIAGMTLEGQKEFRAGPLAKGLYIFEIEECKLTSQEMGTEKTNRPLFLIVFVVKQVLSQVEDPENLLGKKHYERIVLFDAERGLGTFVAFCKDMQLPPEVMAMNINDVCLQLQGRLLQGEIRHRPNRDDPDRPYIELNKEKGKITPVEFSTDDSEEQA